MDTLLRFGKKPEEPKRKVAGGVGAAAIQTQQGNASRLPRAVEDTLAKVHTPLCARAHIAPINRHRCRICMVL